MQVRLTLKHFSGSRANTEDSIALPAAREIVFGRDPECDIRYDESDDLVSRKHLKIVATNEQPARYMVMDLGSRNGTFVNRQRVFGAVLLSPGGHVQLGAGGPEFQFSVEAPPARPLRKRALLKFALITSLCAFAAGASYLGSFYFPPLWKRLHFAPQYKSQSPGRVTPVFVTVESEWVLVDERTGSPLSRAYIANERLSRASLIPLLEGAPVALPAFILSGDRKIEPLLIPSGTERAAKPVGGKWESRGILVSDGGAVLTLPPDESAWNTPWRWAAEDTAGALIVPRSFSEAPGISQVVPLATSQFPRWVPKQSGYLAPQFSSDAPVKLTGRFLSSTDLGARESTTVLTFGRIMKAKLGIFHRNGRTLALCFPEIHLKTKNVAMPVDLAIALLSEATHGDGLQP